MLRARTPGAIAGHCSTSLQRRRDTFWPSRIDQVPNPPQGQESLDLGHLEVVGGDDVGRQVFKFVQDLPVLVQDRVGGK
jgi:hypothetical protein